METRLLIIVIIISHLHLATNTPLRQSRAPRDFTQQTIIYSHPVHNIIFHKSPTLIAPINLSQLVYHNIHVLPLHKEPVTTSFHHKEHVNLFNQPLHHKDPGNVFNQHNVTRPVVLIPIHGLVNDLTVIPLRHDKGRFRVMEKMDEEEPVNQYRNFYGGYGAGLFFGGHGAGHGFYAYGK